MRRRPCGGSSRTDTSESEVQTKILSETMRCISCRDKYETRDASACEECYGKLDRKIKDLNAKVAFLRLSSPLAHGSRSPTGLDHTDVVLFASSGDGPSGLADPIPAHKAVLVSRSPVFKAMLENDMEETRSGTIKIRDVSYDALCAFVNYLYTAEACLDEEMAVELLELAEKYNVEHLKAYCEEFLFSEVQHFKS